MAGSTWLAPRTERVSGEERIGEERKGPDGTGKDWRGTERTGRDRTGAERKGSEGMGGDRIGLERIGTDSFMSNTLEKWPLDFDKLGKGDVIDPATIERWCGLPRTHEKYRFKLMELQSLIDRELGARGINVTVKIHKYGIIVLDDLSASEWNDRQIRHHYRGVLFRAVKLGGVDSRFFDANEKKEHERRLMYSSFMTHALNDGRKQFISQQRSKSNGLSQERSQDRSLELRQHKHES